METEQPAPSMEAPLGAPRMVILGDRTYRVTEFNRRTVLQDHYLQKWVRKIGADRMFPEGNEDTTVFVTRLATHIIDSGDALDLVAGILIYSDVEQWTPDIAKAISASLARCDTADDRDAIATLCVEIAFGFFAEGIRKLNKAMVYAAQAERSIDPSPTH